MNRLRSALFALLVASLADPSLSAADGKPLKVFILAGQSNMEGQAVVDLGGKDYNDGRGTLTTLLADPIKGAPYKHLKSADGQWLVRPDVWIRYQREGAPLLAGPLSLGYSVYGDKHHFGAESIHEAWLNTSALPRIRTQDYEALSKKWIKATGKVPE